MLSDGTNTLTNSVVIAADQAYVDVTLVVIDDDIAEPTETATLTLNAVNGTPPSYNVGTPNSASISITRRRTDRRNGVGNRLLGRQSRPTTARSASAARAARLRR